MKLERHLLFIARGTEIGGERRVWDTLIGGLSSRGYVVHCAVLGSGTDAAQDWGAAGALVTEFDTGRPLTAPVSKALFGKTSSLSKRAIQQLRLVGALTELARQSQVSRIVVQSTLELPMAALVARKCDIPVFWMMPQAVSDKHPMDINRRTYALLGRRANLVALANSHYTLGTLGDHAFPKKVVHLGVDTHAFSPVKQDHDAVTAIRATFGEAASDGVFGLFARLVPQKGLGVLVEALGVLAADGLRPNILVCGGPLDSEYVASVKSRSKRLGVDSQLRFEGPVGNVALYYAACDVVLSAYLGAEGFGLSVVEAMAMQTPVLAHRAGGPGETVVDGQTGWLIDRPNPDSFARGLRRALADRHLWADMGTDARMHVLRYFSEDKMLDRLEDVWSASSYSNSTSSSPLPRAPEDSQSRDPRPTQGQGSGQPPT